MHKFITVFLILTMSGGAFLASGLFYDGNNDARDYFVIGASLVLVIACCLRPDGFQHLAYAVRSVPFAVGVSAVGLALSVYGILQFFHHAPQVNAFFPVTGTFDNPAGFAVTLAITAPASFWLCFGKGRHSLWLRIAAGTASVATAATVTLSGSRSGVMALSASLFVILLTETSLPRRIRRHKLAGRLLLTVVLLCVPLLYMVKPASANGRMLVWCVCLDMIGERPLLGHGTHGFAVHYMDCQAGYFHAHPGSPFMSLADNVTHPFNEFLLLAVNHGIIGLAMALVLMVLLFVRLLRNGGQFRIVGLAVAVSIFIFCMFSYPYHYPTVWFATGLLAVSALPSPPPATTRKRHRATRCALVSASVIVLAITAGMAYMNMRWAEMSKRSMAGQTERMLPHYREMMPVMRHNPLFLYNYAAELNYAERYKESLGLAKECATLMHDYDVQMLMADDLACMDRNKDAVAAYQLAACMIPCRFAPLDGILDIYVAEGDTANADKIACQILTKKIKVPSTTVTEIQRKAKEWLERHGGGNATHNASQ